MPEPCFLVSGCNLPALETVLCLQFLFSSTSALPFSAHQGKTKAGGKSGLLAYFRQQRDKVRIVLYSLEFGFLVFEVL